MSKRKKENVYHWNWDREEKEIKYLAFEGGGGKGIAFLGAIAALEKVGVLKSKTSDGTIIDGTVIGIAGASAGAMAGFLLASGYDTMGVTKALSNTKTFIGFYDGPDVGKTRAVIGNKYVEDELSKAGNYTPGKFEGYGSGKFEGKQFYKFRFKKNEKDGEDEEYELGEKNIDGFDFDRYGFDKYVSRKHKEDYQKLVFKMVDSFPDHWLVNWVAGSIGLIGGSVLGMVGAAADNKTSSNAAFFGSGLLTSLYLLGAVGTKIILPNVIRSKIKKLGENENAFTNEITYTPHKELVDKIAYNLPTLKNYIKNILLDRGLFPGFALRNFLSNAYNDKYQTKGSNKSPGFDNFVKTTKIDFKTVSVNSTTYKPQVFSDEKTPNFPVIDAVAMSSSVPLAFKPVLVKDCLSFSDDGEVIGPPDGYYVDGGFLVNLPMHLFDEAPDGKLHENMLGIRLEILNPEEDKEKKDPGALDIFGGYAGSMLDIALFPSEEGQIRTDRERWQTLDLDVTNIETLQFVSPFERSGPKIIEAYIKTRFMLDKGFKVELKKKSQNNKRDQVVIFDPTIHYDGITNNGEPAELKNERGVYYEFDVTKFITLLPNKMEFGIDGYGFDGYNIDGYNKEGYNEEGYNKEGWDIYGYKNGWDKYGYNKKGYHKDDYDENGKHIVVFDSEGFDPRGFDVWGYDRNGYDTYGLNSEGYDIYGYRNGYGMDGYDIDRYDKYGFDENGWNREGYNKKGHHNGGYQLDPDGSSYDVNGYDRRGYDRNGYNREGYNRELQHKDGYQYGPGGMYDINGYDKDGFGKYGFNREGKDREGKDIKGKVIEVIMENIIDEYDNGTFAKMLLKLKKQ